MFYLHHSIDSDQRNYHNGNELEEQNFLKKKKNRKIIINNKNSITENYLDPQNLDCCQL